MTKEVQNQYEDTIQKLFAIAGFSDIASMEINEIYKPKKNIKILSYNENTSKNEWCTVSNLIRKEPAKLYEVRSYETNQILFRASGDHKILIKDQNTNKKKYFALKNLSVRKKYLSFGIDNSWKEIICKKTNIVSEILDVEVENNSCYFSNNILSHNTMFGDPTTTPGGNAIPYAASVRIKIQSTGQKQITDKDGNTIGIHVKAKTIKNKVARPFRECEFQIHFGVGIREHEEVFDLFRQYCSSLPSGTSGVPCGKNSEEFVMLNGAGAWKTFTVSSASTGEVIIEKKFYKADFGEILYHPEYQKYMDVLYVAALTMHSDAMDHPTYKGINTTSVEEATATQ